MVTMLYLFARFKSGDFDLEGQERAGCPKKFEDAELEALLDEDPCQTQEELTLSLEVTQQTISLRLKAMGMIQKQGNWVPYELKPRDIERRFFACEQVYERMIYVVFKKKAVTITQKKNECEA